MTTKKKFESKYPPLKVAHTVAALIVELQKLPADMPLMISLDDGGVKLVVFNESDDGVGALGLEENDGTWDDHDDTCAWCGELGDLVNEEGAMECVDADACNERINARTAKRVAGAK